MQTFENLRMNLILTGQEVFLAGEISLPLSAMGLPPYIQSFPHTATWQVEVLRYFKEESRIYCHVVSYQTGNHGFLPNQKQIEFLEGLKKISFSSINTTQLMKTHLGDEGIDAMIQQNFLRSQYQTKPDKSAEKTMSYEATTASDLIEEIGATNEKQVIIREIRQTYKVMIKDLRFRFGGVSFTKYLRETEKNEEIIIFNQELREEFDAVKNYFANVLKTKSITARVVFVIKNNVVEEIRAWSPEISRITSTTIETVKFELIDKIRKPGFWIDTERNIFTADDMLDEFLDMKGQKNPLFLNENELFEHFLSIRDVKHYRHLRYLSSKHAHHLMRLRFVIQPFSFVFLVEGERRYYIIWETLNSEEATYLWHTEKDRGKLKLQLSKTEEIINTIKVLGKTSYINSKTDENFRRVLHDYSDPLEGFIRWKGEVDQLLI